MHRIQKNFSIILRRCNTNLKEWKIYPIIQRNIYSQISFATCFCMTSLTAPLPFTTEIQTRYAAEIFKKIILPTKLEIERNIRTTGLQIQAKMDTDIKNNYVSILLLFFLHERAKTKTVPMFTTFFSILSINTLLRFTVSLPFTYEVVFHNFKYTFNRLLCLF